MEVSTVQLYKDLLTILNKNNSEYISPEEFIRYLILSSDDMYNEYLGRRTARRSVYGHNNITDARLNPFRVSTPVIMYNPNDPKISVPEDCKHIRSVTDDFGDSVIYQDDNRFNMLRRDSTVNLDQEAYYKEEGSYLEVLTRKPISEVTIQYLKTPRTPTLVYTEEDRELVFDEVNSVNLEWDSDQTYNLLNRLMILAGLTIKDTTTMQIGRINKSEE